MAWGYRLDLLSGRDTARRPTQGWCCAVRGCSDEPRYLSSYRYVRAGGRAVTATRPLCVKHAQRFSMKNSLAWPRFLRRVRRPMPAVWELAA